MSEKPIQIEQTAKRWKAIQAVGMALAAIGLVGVFVAVNRPLTDGTRLAAGCLGAVAAVGLISYAVGGLLAWWHHG